MTCSPARTSPRSCACLLLPLLLASPPLALAAEGTQATAGAPGPEVIQRITHLDPLNDAADLQWIEERLRLARLRGDPSAPDAEATLRALMAGELRAEAYPGDCIHKTYFEGSNPIMGATALLKCETPVAELFHAYVDLALYEFPADQYPNPSNLQPIAGPYVNRQWGRRTRPTLVDLSATWEGTPGGPTLMADSMAVLMETSTVDFSYSEFLILQSDQPTVHVPVDTNGDGLIKLCLEGTRGCDVEIPPSEDGHLRLPFEAHLSTDSGASPFESIDPTSSARILLIGDNARACYAEPSWTAPSVITDGEVGLTTLLDFGPECYLPDKEVALSVTYYARLADGSLVGGTWIPAEAVKLVGKGQP